MKKFSTTTKNAKRKPEAATEKSPVAGSGNFFVVSVIAFFVFLLLITSFAQAADLTSKVSQGETELIAEINKVKVTLAERVQLQITTHSPHNLLPVLPEMPEQLGNFLVKSVSDAPVRMEKERAIHRRTVILEPIKQGKLEIFAIPVEFFERPQNGAPVGATTEGTATSSTVTPPSLPTSEAATFTLQTKSLTVEVTTSVKDPAASFSKIDTFTAPEDTSLLAYWLGGVAVALLVVLVLALLVWRFVFRRKKKVKVRVLTPQEIALAALAKLQESGLAQQEPKIYYVELTRIVRIFIESTTGIRAPEQTTGEFLRQVSQENTFSPEMKQKLARFLESADLVKFAAHKPNETEVDESIHKAKDFVTI